jgi:anti-sigma factor RsiW
MSEEQYREWDGAYVLGALSPEERREYEEHLTVCPACAEQVAELAGLPGLLGRLDAGTALALRDLPAPEPSPGRPVPSPDLVAPLARWLVRRRRITAFAVAAAVVGALVAGAAVGAAVPPPAPQATRLQPVAGSAVQASLTATAVPWGTRLSWSCTYPPGGRYAPTGYRLVVTTRTGASSVVATWTASGAGASGLSAATAVPRDEIAAIDIRATGSDVPLAQVRLAG